jgi:hypothetical protein
MSIKSGGGRPQSYKTADGKRVPGVTTIVGRFKDSGGLIHWAWQQGIDGKNYRETRDNAADAGGIAHDMIEADILGKPTPEFPQANPEHIVLASKALEAFCTWRDQVKLEILETEVPLISEAFRFGGTFDALALVAGKVVLLDWKTSNGVYGDYIAQVAAYRQLLRERALREPSAPVPEGAQLLRFGKEFGDFHAHYYPSEVLDKGWRFFELGREMYDIDAIIKKVAA